MVYLLDTCVLRELLNHFPKQGTYFVKVWQKIEGLIGSEIFSVDECYNELEKQFDSKSKNMAWLNKQKSMFLNPTNEESLIIKSIFASKKMQESIHLKNILENRPSADVYLVAKAKALNATIVTIEKPKANSAQLPNICQLYNVPHIGYEEFMEILAELIE